MHLDFPQKAPALITGNWFEICCYSAPAQGERVGGVKGSVFTLRTFLRSILASASLTAKHNMFHFRRGSGGGGGGGGGGRLHLKKGGGGGKG